MVVRLVIQRELGRGSGSQPRAISAPARSVALLRRPVHIRGEGGEIRERVAPWRAELGRMPRAR